MSAATETLILSALLPIIVTIGIGYLSGRHHDFAWDQAGTLNKAVMLYALPMNLFSGIVVTPRATLLDLGPLSIALIVALVLSFSIPLVVIRYVFRRDLAMSALQALAIGSPAVPFIGVSVLGVLFGPISTSLITISGFAQNLFQLPLCLVLMSVAAATAAKSAPASTPAASGNTTPVKSATLWSHVVDAAKQPVVWAPVLAATNVAVVAIGGVPAALVFSPSSIGNVAPAAGATLTTSVQVQDASGATIVSGANFTAPDATAANVVFTGCDSHLSPLPPTFSAANPGELGADILTLTYDGLAAATSTLHCSASGPGALNAQFTLTFGSAGAPIYWNVEAARRR